VGSEASREERRESVVTPDALAVPVALFCSWPIKGREDPSCSKAPHMEGPLVEEEEEEEEWAWAGRRRRRRSGRRRGRRRRRRRNRAKVEPMARRPVLGLGWIMRE